MTSRNTSADATTVPWIDPDSTEGAAIIDLLQRLTSIKHAESCRTTAGDVVDELTVWLRSLGLRLDDDPDQAVRHLRRGPHPWTVFGLRDNDCQGETLIAAVVAGDVPCRDSTGEDGGYQRVAESVIAADTDEAERKAYELFEAARD